MFHVEPPRAPRRRLRCLAVTDAVDTRLAELAGRHALSATAPAALRRLLQALAEAPVSLSSVTGPAAAVDVHVADSLVSLDLPELRAAKRIADLGSGGGFPGLALAIALPDAQVALVESVGKKCAFLRETAASLGLANVAVVERRAEAWPEGLGRHDVVTARAVAPLAVLTEYAAPLLRVGGLLVAWKGRPEEAEETAGARAAAALGLEPRPALTTAPYPDAGERQLNLYLKVGSTPNGYPRRPGMARKRPLGGSTAP